MASEYDALLDAQPTQQKSEYDALLTPEQPKQEGGLLSGIASEAKSLAGQAFGALNPINLVRGVLDFQPRSGLQEVLRTGRMLRDIVGGASIGETVQKEAPEVAQQQKSILGEYGPESQKETLTGIGTQLGLAAAPFIHGTVIPLRDIAFGQTPEVTPQIPETPVEDIVEPIPVTPEERFPSLLRSDENLRRGELQQQLNKERGFELVPEPPPDIAPAPTLEQTLETAQVPEPRVSPETGFTFPNEPIETSTGIQSETAKIGGEPDAVQEPSTREVLQRQPEEVGTTGGERTGVEQIVQGQKTPQASTQEIASGITPEAQKLVDSGGIPGFVSKNLERIATENGITDIDKKTPNQIIDELKAKSAPAVPQPEQTTPEITPSEEPTGGVHAEALADRPIDTIPAGEEIGWQDARKLGNDFLDKGGSINKVMADFNRTGKLSVKDIGAGRAYLERLQAVTDRTQDALRENPTDPVLQHNYGAARAAEQRFSEDFKPMATAASNQLKGFQGKVPLTDDMADSVTALTRKYGEIQGKPVTPEEVVKADRIAKTNAKAKADYGSANGELYQKIDTEYGRIRTSRTAPPTLEDLGKTFGQTLKEVCDV